MSDTIFQPIPGVTLKLTATDDFTPDMPLTPDNFELDTLYTGTLDRSGKNSVAICLQKRDDDISFFIDTLNSAPLKLGDLFELACGDMAQIPALSFLDIFKDIDDLIEIDAFSVQYDPAGIGPTLIGFGLKINKSWTITDKLVIAEVGLEMYYKHGSDCTSFTGAISGDLVIAGEAVDVSLHMGASEEMELSITAKDEAVGLPSIGDIVSLLDASIGDTIKDDMAAIHLDDIVLESIDIGFSPAAQTLDYLTVNADVKLFGITAEVGIMLPNLHIDGRLKPGSTINFVTVAAAMGINSPLVPDFTISSLDLGVGIADKSFSFDLYGFMPVSDKSLGLRVTVSFTEGGTSGGAASAEVIGELTVVDLKLQDIAAAFGFDLPDELKALDLALECVSFTYDSTGETLLFSVQGKVSGNDITFTIIHAKTQDHGTTTSSSFGGNLYSPGGNSINLGGSFPIKMGITDLFVAKISHTPVGGKTSSFTVFGSDLNVNGDIDLSTLPVVGDFLKEAKFSFNALRIVNANAQIKADELTGINGFLAQINVAPLLTPQSTVANNASTPASFAQGYSLQGSLVLGDNAEVIPLHSSFLSGASAPTTSSTSGATSTSATGTAATLPLDSSSPASPSPVGKKFGPVSIESVSLGLKGSKVCLTFSGGLLVGPLGLDFIGLEITSPVDKFSPSITLHGLGLNINKQPLTLDGLFVESTINLPATGDTTPSITGYSGSLTVGYKDYALTAMGSYAKLPDGVTSIFIYGFLGAPLGGLPAILMITGAAAGFGYNRAFNLPSPETINTFPLIQPVIPGNTLPVDFNAMNLDFMPQEGSFWGAVGIRVESFKMIESLVLLSIKFNVELEIDILGIATMQFPVPDQSSSEPPLAKIGIGLVARILPERGIVAVNGAFLPSSYVFNPNASITGGFAMLSVFKDQSDGQWSGANEGDFILTLGGYGPLYKPQAYYPQVSRLEMNWKVSDALFVKADAYFAITPQAMMAGGHLVANFQAGGDFSIQVVFTVGADFIIYWKPYRYLGHMYADLAVTARIDVSFWLFSIHASVDFDLSADLKIWGPSFSGYASVSVHVLVSFTVGISFGEDEQTPQPIGWDDFSSGFLPASDKILSANIGRGLIASQSSPAINVVNAKELVVILGTAIPVKTVTGIPDVISSDTEFGIKPMAKTSDDFSSELTLTISKGKTELKDKTEMTNVELSTHFTFKPITKNMPAALWQPATTAGVIPGNDKDSLILGLLSGVRISAKTPEPVAGTSCQISANEEDVINTAPATKGASFSYGTGFSRAA
ncbi:MAG TPA: DUF6603 domain-containing protein [Methylobacter sp.]|jgi:hypothetical protein